MSDSVQPPEGLPKRRRRRQSLAMYFATGLGEVMHLEGDCGFCDGVAENVKRYLTDPDFADTFRRVRMRLAARARRPLAIDGHAYRRRNR